MGSRIVQLTNGIERVTSAGAVGIEYAVDVTGFRTARLALHLVGVENPDSPHLSIALQTAMDLKDVDNAPIIGVFVFTEGKGLVMTQNFPGLLRYLWWNAFEFAGEGADAYQFSLSGVVYD